MFPYPSGEGLHVGHVRIFTACDVMARYFRAKSAHPSTRSARSGSPKAPAVLSPMGWDAFGLPAENAAIKFKKIPQQMVPHNYANFKKQMQALSLSFDWKHEFATTDPTYYGLTQWLFLKLYEKGLVYREEVAINWCPKCKTGLANEEVMGDGTHERCGTPVTKKNLPQWVMRITEYADRLLGGLDEDLSKWFGKSNLTVLRQAQDSQATKSLDWPRGILEMQRNWIGKKEGVVIHHQVKDMDLLLDTFSAYPAWLFADTFIVIAPEHPLVKRLTAGTKYEKDVRAFVEESATITNQQRVEDKFEKKGVFTGRYALDPFNSNREMPIWVANFAMMDFGTGIIRCSAHDVRDYEFATKYKISMNEVVDRTDPHMPVNAHLNEGTLRDSGPFTGKAISPELIGEMVQWIVDQKIGRREVTYHLRDWVFSRQRYWGEPIPLVYCDKCGDKNGVVPLFEKDLPLTLPELASYEPTDTGESPLSRVTTWVNTTCPVCGGPAKRETDTMPNWAGSCWYFLAYPFWKSQSQTSNLKSQNEKLEALSTQEQLDEYKRRSQTPFTEFWKEVAKPAIDEWLPVDWYLGGAEHAVLHLLYARFWVKVFQDLGLVDFSEPFLRLRSVGMVLAEDGRKMSKSWGNVINPDDMIAKYGADATRLYEMFMGPWDQAIAWDSGAIAGQVRFLEKIADLVKNPQKMGEKTSPELAMQLSKLGERIEKSILEQRFNTAIAGMMEFVNAWKAESLVLSADDVRKFAQLLCPFAPQTAQKVWESAGGEGSVDEAPWPSFDSLALAQDVPVTIAVQVNGKLRGTLRIAQSVASDERAVTKLALADQSVAKWVTGAPKKIIFVAGRLVNFVV